MRILFNTIRSDNLVNLNVLYYLEQEISKLVECQWSGEGWKNHIPGETLSQTVKRLYRNDPPDWIISNRPNLLEYNEISKESFHRNYRIAVTLTDLHMNPKIWIRVINKFADVSLMRYLYSPYEIKKYFFNKIRRCRSLDPFFYQKNIKSKILHFPWFTDSTIYKPNIKKDWDVIFLGSSEKKIYPLRDLIVKNLPKYAKLNGWRYLIKGRPPGQTISRNIKGLKKEGYIVGDIYADVVARSKIFIFGSSIFKYPLSKYFEIMGSGTLVMADKPQTAETLNFISGENFVEINEKNWIEKLHYYLEDDAERERISKKGYETVMKYHNSQIRARQIISFLENVEKSKET